MTNEEIRKGVNWNLDKYTDVEIIDHVQDLTRKDERAEVIGKIDRLIKDRQEIYCCDFGGISNQPIRNILDYLQEKLNSLKQ